jgi:hypothetical protein
MKTHTIVRTSAAVGSSLLIVGMSMPVGACQNGSTSSSHTTQKKTRTHTTMKTTSAYTPAYSMNMNSMSDVSAMNDMYTQSQMPATTMTTAPTSTSTPDNQIQNGVEEGVDLATSTTPSSSSASTSPNTTTKSTASGTPISSQATLSDAGGRGGGSLATAAGTSSLYATQLSTLLNQHVNLIFQSSRSQLSGGSVPLSTFEHNTQAIATALDKGYPGTHNATVTIWRNQNAY